jgi:hypothetical protein
MSRGWLHPDKTYNTAFVEVTLIGGVDPPLDPVLVFFGSVLIFNCAKRRSGLSRQLSHFHRSLSYDVENHAWREHLPGTYRSWWMLMGASLSQTHDLVHGQVLQ